MGSEDALGNTAVGRRREAVENHCRLIAVSWMTAWCSHGDVVSRRWLDPDLASSLTAVEVLDHSSAIVIFGPERECPANLSRSGILGAMCVEFELPTPAVVV